MKLNRDTQAMITTKSLRMIEALSHDIRMLRGCVNDIQEGTDPDTAGPDEMAMVVSSVTRLEVQIAACEYLRGVLFAASEPATLAAADVEV